MMPLNISYQPLYDSSIEVTERRETCYRSGHLKGRPGQAPRLREASQPMENEAESRDLVYCPQWGRAKEHQLSFRKIYILRSL